MSAVKAAAKRALVRAVAGIAPLTWDWRAPGSLVVLMYHRVLPAHSPERAAEQPGMHVSPETLDLHIRELKKRFELIHLDDWLQRARRGASLPRLACALTFDDGWRDNLEFALPVLQRHAAPATIFLVSDYIGTGQRFWPNRLMSLLARAFADPQSVVFPEALLPIVEPALAAARKRGELCADDGDQAVRSAKRLEEMRIRELIGVAEQSCRECAEIRDVLSGSEVAKMAATGLVRFGSHTATHYRLGGKTSPADLEREVVLSREQLREICGQSIDIFCYPNGEMSPQAIDLVRKHYLGAVTTRPGWQSPSGDPYRVRRIALHEDISNRADAFLARVSGWL